MEDDRDAIQATSIVEVSDMQITRDDDFGGAVLNCAVRYALGRASYMPSLVMDRIRPMLPYCSTKTVAVFVQDVEEWLEQNEPETGFFDNYYDDWYKFLKACEAELDRRKGE